MLVVQVASSMPAAWTDWPTLPVWQRNTRSLMRPLNLDCAQIRNLESFEGSVADLLVTSNRGYRATSLSPRWALWRKRKSREASPGSWLSPG